jgi:hypothetical protein
MTIDFLFINKKKTNLRRISLLTISIYSFFQSNPYGLKENGPTSEMSWTTAGLQPTTGYYSPYDPIAYG